MNTPAITVVIPAFNPDQRLLRSLACLRAQDLEDHEVIVVQKQRTTATRAVCHLGNPRFL